MSWPMNREELAGRLSENVRVRRLERIGEPVLLPGVSFDELPEEDRRNWLDVADAVLELEHETATDANARLETIDRAVRLIVELDLPLGERLTTQRREVLIGHLTGALFVHTERKERT